MRVDIQAILIHAGLAALLAGALSSRKRDSRPA